MQHLSRAFHKKPIMPTMVAAVLSAALSVLTFAVNGGTAAAACAAPSTDYGAVSVSVSVPSTATYRIWARMMVPNTTSKTFLLEVDGGNCYNMGGGSFSANTWTWVDYRDGNTGSIAQQSLSAGNHTFKLVGNADGVKVDRVIASSDTSCVPSGNGDNCNTPNDTIAPTVTLTAPKEGATVSGATAVTATATDNVAVGRVEFYDNTTLIGTDTSAPYSVTWDSSKVANGSHLITARAYDASGNVGTDTNTVTARNGDTQAPTAPTGLSATATAYNSIKLTWKAASDNTGVAAYAIVRDGVPIATVGAVTTYGDTGLNANTSYSYQVQAIDAAGNKSPLSGKVSTKTPNVADSEAPSKVTGLAAQAVNQTQVNLSWQPATDNIGVVSYDIYRSTGSADPKIIGTSSTASYGDSNLTADTTYAYYVVAKDASANAGPASDTISVTTPKPITQQDHSRITGKVTDQATGHAIPYAIVKIVVDGRKHTYRADRFGRYAMFNLKTGRYNVVYKAPGYYAKTVSIQLGTQHIIQNVSLKKR